MSSRKVGSTGPGTSRAINMRSTREVIGLIRLLEAQGARAQWANPRGGRGSGNSAGSEGSFPCKVYPPDPDKGHILFHGSVSDQNAATLKRNEVRRAGLWWPGDLPDSHRIAMTATKEAPVSTPVPDRGGLSRKDGEHAVVPPAVATRQYPPLREQVEAFRDQLTSLGETFWTDEALGLARKAADAGVPNMGGYGTSSGMTKAQQLLDWLGYRVIDTRPNRGGKSYRWYRDPDAAERTDYGVAPGLRPQNVPKLTAVPPLQEEHEAPKVELDPLDKIEAATLPPLPASPGPVAQALAEAQRQKAERDEKAKHPRLMCEEPGCVKWFTPEGRDHHYQETGHGPVSEKMTTVQSVQSARIEALRGGPVDLEQAVAEETEPYDRQKAIDSGVRFDDDPRDEAAEWRALIEEAEAETARVRAELAREREENARRLAEIDADKDRALAERNAARDAEQEAHRRLDIQRQRTEQAVTERDQARAEVAVLEATPVREVAAEDGSWVIDPKPIGLQMISNAIEDGAKYGIVIELRGRRA